MRKLNVPIVAATFLFVEILAGCYLALDQAPMMVAAFWPTFNGADLAPLVGGLAASGVLSALGWLTTCERRCQYC